MSGKHIFASYLTPIGCLVLMVELYFYLYTVRTPLDTEISRNVFVFIQLFQHHLRCELVRDFLCFSELMKRILMLDWLHQKVRSSEDELVYSGLLTASPRHSAHWLKLTSMLARENVLQSGSEVNQRSFLT